MVLVDKLEDVSNELLRPLFLQYKLDLKAFRVCVAHRPASELSKDEKELLLRNKKLIDEVGVEMDPAIMINGQFMGGDMTETDVLSDICQSLVNPPKICDTVEKLQEKGRYIDEPTGVASDYRFFLLLVLGLFILAICCFYICTQRQLKREFREKLDERVNDALSKYYQGESQQGQEYRGADFSQMKVKLEEEEEADSKSSDKKGKRAQEVELETSVDL